MGGGSKFRYLSKTAEAPNLEKEEEEEGPQMRKVFFWSPTHPPLVSVRSEGGGGRKILENKYSWRGEEGRWCFLKKKNTGKLKGLQQGKMRRLMRNDKKKLPGKSTKFRRPLIAEV